MRGSVATPGGRPLRKRWLRWTLIGLVTVSVAAVAVVALGSSGGVVVRDDDGCPRSVGAMSSVEWIDALHIEDRNYERVDIVAPHVARVERGQLGDRLATITCTTGERVQDPGYRLRNGEATFLEPGTPVHALVGVPVGFRVAAIEDGQPVVYEHRAFEGSTGADLLPFPADDVIGVTFLSEVDGRTVLGKLSDPGEVRRFVEALQAAPVGDRPNLGEEPRVFVALEFAEFPATTVVTYPAQATTPEGLQLPGAVVERIPAPATRP